MTDRFEMSMMRGLKYFLGFQIKQLEDGTFINQTKYVLDLLKKFGMDKAKPIKTPKGRNQVVRQAREERASDIIQKVEHPLRTDYEYNLRRVDHHHPRRPTNFTRG
jgi:hypothetical protein